MAKYSFQFKKQVIDAYLRGEGGYTYLAGKYGVTNRRQALNWVHNYEKYGDQGLMCSRKQISSICIKLARQPKLSR